MTELKGKQRSYLAKMAHSLKPVVIIGKAGFTEGMLKTIDSALLCHELLKIKLNQFKEERFQTAKSIEEQLGAQVVTVIGNIIIVYRQAEKHEDRKYHLPKTRSDG